MPSLKALSEEYAEHEEIFDKLGTDVGIAKFVQAGRLNDPSEAADARNASHYHMTAAADQYAAERQRLLAVVKASSNYIPGIIIVLGGEQFVEDERGEFVKVK